MKNQSAGEIQPSVSGKPKNFDEDLQREVTEDAADTDNSASAADEHNDREDQES